MYRYRVTLEPLTDTEPIAQQLQFEADCHDDILKIINRVPGRFGLAEDESRAMVVGLKLLGEIVLKHRDKEPFSQLKPALREFIQSMKQQ